MPKDNDDEKKIDIPIWAVIYFIFYFYAVGTCIEVYLTSKDYIVLILGGIVSLIFLPFMFIMWRKGKIRDL